MATEFMIAVIVGGAIGWYLDDWLGTKPWLMVIFFFLGVGAGFLNIFRAAAAISEDGEGED
jgi:ATP synthase protein I